MRRYGMQAPQHHPNTRHTDERLYAAMRALSHLGDAIAAVARGELEVRDYDAIAMLAGAIQSAAQTGLTTDLRAAAGKVR